MNCSIFNQFNVPIPTSTNAYIQLEKRYHKMYMDPEKLKCYGWKSMSHIVLRAHG